MKVTATCGFFLCVSMHLLHILTKFHCSKFKTFFLAGILRDPINHSEKSMKYLVKSMPSRLEDIIRREGNPIKY
jgi:hypothetical protein